MSETIILNGIEFLEMDWIDSRFLFAREVPKGAETIEDTKDMVEELLQVYIEQYPYIGGVWSIEMESKEGDRVEMRWSCNSLDESDEFVTTHINNEEVYDNNHAVHLWGCYARGDAKFQLETMTDEEWRETSKQWFEEHIDRIIELFPDSFTPEHIAEANRVRELLCED
ncbi:MAG: hypothetical protein HXN01_02445 [Porphyromonadaceae bacterium]|nr:hypothetical protein [Porphyromonadaceae bacterium]